jgi:hypothetical protein
LGRGWAGSGVGLKKGVGGPLSIEVFFPFLYTTDLIQVLISNSNLNPLKKIQIKSK